MEDVSIESADPPTEQLLSQVELGDAAARNALLDRHRQRLKALVAMRIQPGLASRVDASDIVQDSLTEAYTRLPKYLAERPLPFYLWLRELTLERLVDSYRTHAAAQKRSVYREEHLQMPDESMNALAQVFITRSSSPSHRVQRLEMQRRVREVLEELSENDREILVLRHLEQLSVQEIATVLNLTPSAVKVRNLRAMQRLRVRLQDLFGEDGP